MNSTLPRFPPISDNYYNAGNDGGDQGFPNPMMNPDFPLLPPKPIPTTTLNPSNYMFTDSEAKSLAASRSHKEAERLRRQRINYHLATLRTLLPNLIKTDKASLLGEVVRRLKELKETTSHLTEASTALASEEKLIPEETDVVKVRRCDANGVWVATMSCEERPGLLADLSRALNPVKAKVVRAEIATVGGRTKILLWLKDDGGREGFTAVNRALKVVVDRPNCSAYSPSLGLFGPKRQRVSQ